MSVNKVIILGRLGQDPELKHTPSGSAVCTFSLATSESWTDKSGQKQEKTEWHRIVVWGKIAELSHQYLSKGRQAYIEGKLQTRSWDDKDGTKRYTTEILAQTVQFLGSNADGRTSQSPSAPSYQSSPQMKSSFDDSFGQGYGNTSGNDQFASDDIPF